MRYYYLLIAGLLLAGLQATAPGPYRIEINAQGFDDFEPRFPSHRHFGALEFRGGIVLTSSAKAFGGFSGLRVEQDGAHFLALSDRCSWLRGRIVYEGSQPAGITDAEMAPVLDSDGKPAGWDTEAIAADDGVLYVGIERKNIIARFEYGKEGLLARGEPIAVPPGVKDLPFNQGLEAVVFAPAGHPLAGSIIALSEKGLDESGNLKAFLIGGPAPGAFAVKRTDGYDISDAALLPGGDLLILERQYSMERGLAMRIRRISSAQIKAGTTADGPIVIEADQQYQIDNMEALSVHRAASGEIVLTLMSDDNFSPIQRTILLQFAFAK